MWKQYPLVTGLFVLLGGLGMLNAANGVVSAAMERDLVEAHVLLIGYAVTVTGVVAQMLKKHWGLWLTAIGLAALAILGDASTAPLGFFVVCWETIWIAVNLKQNRGAWLTFLTVGACTGAAVLAYQNAYEGQSLLHDFFLAPYFMTAQLLVLAAIAICWLTGIGHRHRLNELEFLRDRAELATMTERNRIAREMHDIISHSLSVVIAQADGGRYAGKKNPGAALEALETISEEGRKALNEMRGLLSVLREQDERDFSATLGLKDIEKLIADFRAAGLRIQYLEVGESQQLTTAEGLCVYRVVQEACTNVLKHAGKTDVAITLDWRKKNRVIVAVENEPGAPTVQQDGKGMGLTGIKERVGVFGGHADWGERAQGGWYLKTEIPLQKG